MARKTQHRFHGAPGRFEAVSEYIYDEFGRSIVYIADVAGGQGMLSRILQKRFNYICEVIDPKGHTMKGVAERAEEFQPSMASYYDLVVGLHPDEATIAIAESALLKPVILIPCCNFWSEDKLGRDELINAIASYYDSKLIRYKIVTFDFAGPKNIGLVSCPP